MIGTMQNSLISPTLTRFQQILLGTDGSVTHIMEAYSQEEMEAVKLRQELAVATEADADLDVTPGVKVMRRQVVLRGRSSRQNLLYAEAVMVPERLPPMVLSGLLETDTPIGRLLARNRTETFREVLMIGREAAESCGPLFGVPRSAEFIFRTYRILAGKQPMMLITEKFPATFFLGIHGDTPPPG